MKRTAILIFSMLAMVACGGGGSGGGGSSNAPDLQANVSSACPGGTPAVVDIVDNINSTTTWKTNTIYVIRKWDFYVNGTLIIEPGVIIKFHSTKGPGLTLGNAGAIIAEGTAVDPIIFTSFRDDAHGCDNNGDGAGTVPARGDWGTIDTNSLNGSVFDHCEFYYGGSGAYTATLSISDSTATVTNSIFAHNDGGDESGMVGALDASTAIAGTFITGNTFFDNVRPLSISTAFDVDDSNSFSNPDDFTETNTYNAIFVDSINHVIDQISWEETDVPFVIYDGDFWINSGGRLTLGDNVVLKFRPGSEIVLADGESALGNHGGPGVFFTSYRDDSHLGDTNADLGATHPATGDWIGIYDDTTSDYSAWLNILYDEIH